MDVNFLRKRFVAGNIKRKESIVNNAQNCKLQNLPYI
jgi:hypothetical protein